MVLKYKTQLVEPHIGIVWAYLLSLYQTTWSISSIRPEDQILIDERIKIILLFIINYLYLGFQKLRPMVQPLTNDLLGQNIMMH